MRVMRREKKERADDVQELRDAVQEVKRKSIYPFSVFATEPEIHAQHIYPFNIFCEAKKPDPPGDTDPGPLTVEEAARLEAEAKSAEKSLEKETPKEQHEAEEKLEYPACSTREGMSKVRCLVGSILADRSIDKEKKIRRINYLVALNSRNKWASEAEVREIVERARAKLK